MKIEDLPFDLVDYGNKLGSWHASQGDPVYAVGSYARIGELHPSRETVVELQSIIENLIGGKHNTDEMDEELAELLSHTEELLKCYSGWVWNDETHSTQEEIEEAIQCHLVDELTNHSNGQVIGPDGTAYNIKLTAELVPA